MKAGAEAEIRTPHPHEIHAPHRDIAHPLLSLENISVRAAQRTILNSVSFEISPGSMVGIIGPNGSGKTTLFNCISGFMPVGSGRIRLNGCDITSVEPHLRARHGLGRVFQNFGIFREMTVLENMVTALEANEPWWSTAFPWGASPRRIRGRALELLEQVKLHDKAEDKASSLSGGQMRLLEIMRTVALGADLFLLDEPTAGVSPKMKDAVAELVMRLHDQGKTVLVIEHDINFIQRFCGRIIVLEGGRVVLDGRPEEVRQSKMLHEIYFGGGR